jgi:hypothetical protein
MRRYCNLIAIGLLILGLVFYLYRIDKWFMHDDEGGYSYAAWRISEGDMPYRDFLTPQLPLFLYWGGIVVKVFGPSALALRYVTVLTALLAAFFAYLVAKVIFGYRVALLTLLLFLLQKDIYFIARFFRPEAYMLLFALLGMYVFALSYGQRRRWRMFLAGVLLGLAMLCKLFAALCFGGCVLFLLFEWVTSRDRHWLGQTLAFTGGFVIIAGTVFVAFQILCPSFLTDVFEHHVMQGAQLTLLQVVAKALVFYWGYVRANPVFVLLALLGLARTRLAPRSPSTVLAWQVPTAAAFLLLSRELEDRHLVYLVPALCALAASSLESLLSAKPIALGLFWNTRRQLLLGGSPKLVVGLLLAALTLWPSLSRDLEIAGWEEEGTQPLATYIQALTSPDEYVLCDYPGLNFHAQRKNTYLGAGLSGGATSSGQITGAALIREIEAKSVKLVLINTSGGAHQLVALRDYADFYRYVQSHFHFVRIFHRSYETFEVYYRDELMTFLPESRFDNKLALTGADLGQQPVPSGQSLSVVLRWQVLESMPRDYTVSLRLLDAEGHPYGQEDALLQRIFTSGWQGDKEQIEHVPTSQWASGVQVMGEYVLPVAPATPPGEYSVGVLLYDLASGQVLPVRDALGQARGVDYPLAMVEVTLPGRPPTLDELAIHQRIEQDFGGDLRLLGRGPIAETARPGDSVGVALFWQALRGMEQNWQLVLRVRAADGNLLAEGRFEPANAGYPTSKWSADEVVMGQYDLMLDRNAAAGQAQWTLNWLDAATGQPMLPEDYVLGQTGIVGESRQLTVPETIQHRLDANLGDRVSLLGYDLAEDVIPAGGSLHLTLYWQARTTMETSYTVFTHLLGSDGHVWAQKDSVPRQGSYPTTAWLSGEVVVDPYVIEVPADASPGEYVLEVGMYVAASGDRLPVLDASGQRVDDRVLLPPVRVGS